MSRPSRRPSFWLLFAVFLALAGSVAPLVMVERKMAFPSQWPGELAQWSGRVTCYRVATANQEDVYEIEFTDRAEFERFWPVICRVKTPKAPLRLRTANPKADPTGEYIPCLKPSVRVYTAMRQSSWRADQSGKPVEGKDARPDFTPDPRDGSLPEYMVWDKEAGKWIAHEGPWQEARGFLHRVRTEIELVVDGDVIDLNRIRIPTDTPIIDRRVFAAEAETED